MSTKSAIERMNDRGSGGLCRIEVAGGSVQAQCEWPLDLDSNEWFNFSMSFPVSTWENILKTLHHEDKAKVIDSAGNRVSFIKLNDADVAVEMNQRRGALATSLYLDKAFTLSDLHSLSLQI